MCQVNWNACIYFKDDDSGSIVIPQEANGLINPSDAETGISWVYQVNWNACIYFKDDDSGCIVIPQEANGLINPSGAETGIS